MPRADRPFDSLRPVRLLGAGLMEGAKEATFTTTEMSVLFLSMGGGCCGA